MKHIYILCGVAFSGKSTWIKNKIKELNYKRCFKVNADLIREEINGDPTSQENTKQVFWHVFKRYTEALGSNDIDYIFVDNTSLSENYRARYRFLAKEVCESMGFKYDITIVYFKPNLSELLTRAEINERGRSIPVDVIKRMVRSIEPPTEYERNNCNIIEIES